jgi:hypothetical protein
MSFADLKKRSKSGSLTEKLLKQVDKLNEGGSSNEDDRLWKPTLTKAGIGQATIRFLPARLEEWEDEYVQVFNHAFQGPTGQWLIDNCPTTLGGRKCPICDHNREDWNTGSKEKQNIVRDRKRKLSYYSNIYVIDDPENPNNNGRVFLYKYGKKIWEKIEEALRPKFKGETAINVFDMWEGADFNLKICKVDGYWNYDKSNFDKPSELLDGDDKELETLYKSMYNLNDFIDESKFKSYDELKNRLDLVLGLRGDTRKKVDPEVEEEAENDYERLVESKKTASKSVSKVQEDDEDDEDADDALNYFSKLASM